VAEAIAPVPSPPVAEVARAVEQEPAESELVPTVERVSGESIIEGDIQGSQNGSA